MYVRRDIKGAIMHKRAQILYFVTFFAVGTSAFAQEAGDKTDDAKTDATKTDAAKTDDAKPAVTLPTFDAPPEPTHEVISEAALNKQLHEVSANLDTLKEDTFTTKSRLMLLREEILQRSVGGSRVQLRHKNDMGGQYDMVQIYYAIDREPVYKLEDPDGELNALDDIVVYDRILPPGTHQLTTMYVYRGKAWGAFQYMHDYTFRVESGYDFVVEEGKSAELTVTASETGNFFTPYEERPWVAYDYQQYDVLPSEAVEGESGDAK